MKFFWSPAQVYMVGTGTTALIILTGTAFWSVMTPSTCSGLMFVTLIWAGYSLLQNQIALLSSRFLSGWQLPSLYDKRDCLIPQLSDEGNRYLWHSCCYCSMLQASHLPVCNDESGWFACIRIALAVSIRPISRYWGLHYSTKKGVRVWKLYQCRG